MDAWQLGLLRGLGFGRRWPLAQVGELGSERLEFGLRRIVSVEYLARIAAVAELCQNVGWFRRGQVVLDIGADAREMDAPDLRMPRKCER